LHGRERAARRWQETCLLQVGESSLRADAPRDMERITIAYLVRRTIGLATLLAIAGAAAFVMIASMPGSYDVALRLEPHYSADAAAAFEHRHDLDRPVGARIVSWLAAAGRGSLGTSIEYDAPVAPLVATRAARTLVLAGVATVLAWLVALPVGVAMAAGSRTRWDRAGDAMVTAALAVPEPVLVIGLTVLAARSGVVPTGGNGNFYSGSIDACCAFPAGKAGVPL
jgi:peptide/nickel transport system permease protein